MDCDHAQMKLHYNEDDKLNRIEYLLTFTL